jgi:hypothetical protein
MAGGGDAKLSEVRASDSPNFVRVLEGEKTRERPGAKERNWQIILKTVLSKVQMFFFLADCLAASLVWSITIPAPMVMAKALWLAPAKRKERRNQKGTHIRIGVHIRIGMHGTMYVCVCKL